MGGEPVDVAQHPLRVAGIALPDASVAVWLVKEGAEGVWRAGAVEFGGGVGVG